MRMFWRSKARVWRAQTTITGGESLCWQISSDNNVARCGDRQQRIQRKFYLQWEDHSSFRNANTPDFRFWNKNTSYPYFFPIKEAISAVYGDSLNLLNKKTGVIFTTGRKLAAAGYDNDKFCYKEFDVSTDNDWKFVERRFLVWLTTFQTLPESFRVISMSSDGSSPISFQGVQTEAWQDTSALHRGALRAWIGLDEDSRSQYRMADNAKNHATDNRIRHYFSSTGTSAFLLLLLIMVRLGLGWIHADSINNHAENQFSEEIPTNVAKTDYHPPWKTTHVNYYSKVYPVFLLQSLNRLLEEHSIGEWHDFQWQGGAEGSFDLALKSQEEFADVWQLISQASIGIGYWLQLDGLEWVSRNSATPLIRVRLRIVPEMKS